MKRLVLLIIPIFVYGESLTSLLQYATFNNDLVIAKGFIKQAKEEEIQASKSSFYPTIDVGTYYQTANGKSPFQAGDVYSGYAKLSYDVYDGGKKSATLKQKKSEYIAASLDSKATKKGLALAIVRDFYNIKSLQASLVSREEAQSSLKEQLIRVKRFYQAKVATKDDIDRLQASYDTNIYDMESIKLEIFRVKKSLELKVGRKIKDLDNSKFQTSQEVEIQLSDDVKSLVAKKDALLRSSEGVDSIYYPQIKIEDTFSIYGYDREDPFIPDGGVKNQNKLLISLNLRVFDNGAIEKSKQSVVSNAQALNSQVAYSTKEQKMNYELAREAILTTKIKIKSAKSALVSANSAFDLIKKKYDAGIVDYVVYLNALTAQTNAKALYERSVNDLEIAYGAYYYYSGKKVEEFLQ